MTGRFKVNQILQLASFCIFTCFLLIRISICLSPVADISGIEQNVVYGIQIFLKGDLLYKAPFKAPFSITQYTPLYYYLCGYTARLVGYGSPSKIHEIYVIGRIWCLIFNLLSATIIFFIGHKIFQLSKNKSIILFLISFIITFPQNFAVRSDSLSDMLGLISIFLFLIYQKDQSKKVSKYLILLPIVFITILHVFSKQSGIQIIFIIIGFSLIVQDFRGLLIILFASIPMYFGIFKYFQWIYPSFLENVIGGIDNGIDLGSFVSNIWIQPIFILSVWPIIISVFYSIIKNKILLSNNRLIQFIGISVLGSFIFATLTALKMGSAKQYYILFINLASLLVMIELTGYTNSLFDKSRISIYLIPLYLIIIISIFATQDYNQIKKSFDINLSGQRESVVEVAQFIQKDSEDDNKFVFANLSSDSFYPSRQGLNNILYKKCLVPQLDILDYSVGPSKIFGYKALEDLLENGQVQYIVESSPPLKFRILRNFDSIRISKFSLVKKINGYLVYKFNRQ